MQSPICQPTIAAPLCPSCSHHVASGDRACLSCGYSFEFASQLLPYEAPELRKFIDREGQLTREDISKSQRALQKLRKKFPQVTLSTCVVNVPDGVSISEFGFWLFNQSIPNGPRLIEQRLHTILLCIDPKQSEASLTVGYGLDPYLSDEALSRCLKKMRKPMAAKFYGKAIAKLCKSLQVELDRGYELAKQVFKSAKPQRIHTPVPPTQSHPAPAKLPVAHTIHDSHV